MSHYMELFEKEDDKYVAAYQLKEKDITLEIESVNVEEVIGAKGRKEDCPVVRFKGAEKALILNKTNAKMIAKLHGADISKWVKKKVTLYPTTTDFQGDTVECIRIRYEFN